VGQKVHPLGFRLRITQNHRSSWFADKKAYPAILEEDFKIRSYIKNEFSSAGISKIEIERRSEQVELKIHTSRPGIIVGRSGSGIDKIKEDLQKKLKCSTQIRVNVTEVKNMDADANLIGEFIAEQRIPFKRATRQAIQKAQRANAKGIRVQVSGRLNGAEIARSEWVREGRVPLQTLRADIDYATKEANTTYGILGIKVWVFNGEVIPDKSKRRLSV